MNQRLRNRRRNFEIKRKISSFTISLLSSRKNLIRFRFDFKYFDSIYVAIKSQISLITFKFDLIENYNMFRKNDQMYFFSISMLNQHVTWYSVWFDLASFFESYCAKSHSLFEISNKFSCNFYCFVSILITSHQIDCIKSNLLQWHLHSIKFSKSRIFNCTNNSLIFDWISNTKWFLITIRISKFRNF